jgi:hypothetical protein
MNQSEEGHGRRGVLVLLGPALRYRRYRRVILIKLMIKSRIARSLAVNLETISFKRVPSGKSGDNASTWTLRGLLEVPTTHTSYEERFVIIRFGENQKNLPNYILTAVQRDFAVPVYSRVAPHGIQV